MTSVLYVDDERPLLDLGKIFLEKGGFDVKTTDSAIKALELLKTMQFDAIVSDYMMPEMDGIEFLKTIRQNHQTVPFIIFTGKGREEVVIQAFENGANSYIQKGGDPKSQFIELGHKIRKSVDMTQLENKIKESELRYRRLFESAQDGILILDEDGKIIDANPYVLNLTGNTLEELVGKHLFEIGLIKDIELSQNTFKILQRDGYVRYDNLPLKITRDGSIEVEFVCNSYVLDHSKVIQCNIRDISQRKKAERECSVILKKYQILLDLFPQGITISDLYGNIIECNKKAEDLLGLSREEQEKRKIDSTEWNMVRSDGSPMPAEEFASVRALKENQIAYNDIAGVVKKDGTITWIRVTAIPLIAKGYGVIMIYDEL